MQANFTRDALVKSREIPGAGRMICFFKEMLRAKVTMRIPQGKGTGKRGVLLYGELEPCGYRGVGGGGVSR